VQRWACAILSLGRRASGWQQVSAQTLAALPYRRSC